MSAGSPPAVASLYGALRPLLFLLPPETAHGLALRAIRTGLLADGRPDDPILETSLWGRRWRNPLGVAAGFDKNALCLPGLTGMGFGFVEVGGVTPRPQAGNPRPRIFRDVAARAIVNRCGLNNDGADAVFRRMEAYRQHSGSGGGPPIGINLGPNADSAEPEKDFTLLAGRFAPVADFLMVNVSSPNTAGLRDLQAVARLEGILEAVEAGLSMPHRPKIVVKLAPDMAPESLEAVAGLAVSRPLDGLCLSNTTISRPLGLSDAARQQKGGLSGAPLKPLAMEALRRVAAVTRGRVPLIGVGGIESGEDAYRRIRAGASLLQIYSALVFAGPGLVGAIKHDLAVRLRADGFSHVSEAVGVDIT